MSSFPAEFVEYGVFPPWKSYQKQVGKIQFTPIPNPCAVFYRNTKIPYKRPWMPKAIMSKRNNAGSVTIPNLKLYYRPTLIKTAQCHHKNRCGECRNRIKEPDLSSHNYGQTQLYDALDNWLFKKKNQLKMVASCITINIKPCSFLIWIFFVSVCKELLKTYYCVMRPKQRAACLTCGLYS